jgi:hypothetical protein
MHKFELDVVDTYKHLAGTLPDFETVDLRDYVPVISKEDIDAGSIERYFARQVNHAEGYITEISKNEYDKIRRNSLYNTIVITWRISGPVDDKLGPQTGNSPVRLYTGVKTANTLTLAEAERQMPGMTSRIINPTQYYKTK